MRLQQGWGDHELLGDRGKDATLVQLAAARPQPTSWEISSRGASCWLMAAREAWSTSRMHLFRTSMASSHSRCPGALSLCDKMDQPSAGRCSTIPSPPHFSW